MWGTPGWVSMFIQRTQAAASAGEPVTTFTVSSGSAPIRWQNSNSSGSPNAAGE